VSSKPASTYYPNPNCGDALALTVPYKSKQKVQCSLNLLQIPSHPSYRSIASGLLAGADAAVIVFPISQQTSPQADSLEQIATLLSFIKENYPIPGNEQEPPQTLIICDEGRKSSNKSAKSDDSDSQSKREVGVIKEKFTIKELEGEVSAVVSNHSDNWKEEFVTLLEKAICRRIVEKKLTEWVAIDENRGYNLSIKSAPSKLNTVTFDEDASFVPDHLKSLSGDKGKQCALI